MSLLRTLGTIAAGVLGGVAGTFIPGVGPAIGAAVGLSLGGAIFGALAGVPRPDLRTGNQQALANVADPEHPRTAVYGTRMVGWSWVWDEVSPDGGPGEGALYLLTACIVDHPIESIVGVRVNGRYLDVGTNLVQNKLFTGSSGSGGPKWTLPTDGSVYIAVPHSPWNQDFSETGRYLTTAAGRVYEVVSGGVVSATESTNETGANFTSGSATLRYHMSFDPDDPDGPSKGFTTGYQGERDGPVVWHFAIKWFLGGQTAPDPWFGGLSADYASRNRVGAGETYANLAFIAHPGLSLFGSMPTVEFVIQGKNDIETDSGPAFTNSPPYVARDYAIWRQVLSTSNFDQANLDTAAAVCTTDLPGTSTDRYDFNGIIRWDENPLENFNNIVDHMRGYWSQRGDKVVLTAGGARTPVMSLSTDDLVDGSEPIYAHQLEPEERANVVVAHVIQQKDADGEFVFAPRPVTQVSNAVWKANDAGRELRHDFELDGCINLNQGRFHAWVVANQKRLETRLTGTFRLKTMLLEIGDVVTWSDPIEGFAGEIAEEPWEDGTLWTDGTGWAVAGSGFLMFVERSVRNYMDDTVTLTLREYSDDVYLPGAIDDVDLGNFGALYGTDIPEVSIIGFDLLEDSDIRTAEGRTQLKGVLSWNPVGRFWVAGGGSYLVHHRKETGPWRSVSVPGVVTSVELILNPGNHEAKVQARDAFGNTGPWSDSFFFIASTAFPDMQTPPSDSTQGGNLIANPRFIQRALGWNEVDNFHTGTGSITWVTPTTSTPGASVYSPFAARVISGGPSPETPAGGNDYRLDPKFPSTLDPGQFYYCRAWVVTDSSDSTQQDELELQLLRDDLSFIENIDVAILQGPQTPGALAFFGDVVQVPHGRDASYAKLRLINKADSVNGTAGHTTDVWRMTLYQIDELKSIQAGPINGITDTYTDLVSIDNLYCPPFQHSFNLRWSISFDYDAQATGATSYLFFRVQRYQLPFPESGVSNVVFPAEQVAAFGAGVDELSLIHVQREFDIVSPRLLDTEPDVQYRFTLQVRSSAPTTVIDVVNARVKLQITEV